MARKPRSKTISAANKAAREAAAVGDNSENLKQKNSLLHHAAIYERELRDKKEQDASFRNACKLARSDLGEDAIEMIKAHIAFRDPEKGAKLRARMQALIEVARWSNEPVGFQGELWDPETAAQMKVRTAREEGRQAGLDGKDKKPPEKFHQTSDEHAAWLDGYASGQDVLFKGIKKTPEAKGEAVH